MPRDSKYIFEYTRGVEKMKLEIRPAGTTAMDSETPEIALPPGSIVVADQLTREMTDECMIGMEKAPQMEITVNFNNIPVDLIDYLNLRYLENDGVHVFGSYSRQFPLTNTFWLWSDRGYGTEEYYLEFIGCVMPGYQADVQLTKHGLDKKYQLIHIAKYMYEQTQPDDERALYVQKMNTTPEVLARKELFDVVKMLWADVGNGKAAVVWDRLTSPDTNYANRVFFIKRADFFAIKDEIAASVYQQLTRGHDYQDFNYAADGFTYYMQDYESDHNSSGMPGRYNLPGAEVPAEDLWVYASWSLYESGQEWGDNIVGGLYGKESGKLSVYNYENAWDFMYDYLEQNGMRGIFSFNTSYGNGGGIFSLVPKPLHGVLESGSKSFRISKNKDKTKFPTESDLYRRSAIGKAPVFSDRDQKEFKYDNQGTLNQQDFEFKSMFHTMPMVPNPGTVGSYELADHYGIDCNDGIDPGGLYYEITIPWALPHYNGSPYVGLAKVHEYCEYHDGNQTYSEEPDYTPIDSYAWDKSRIGDYMIALKQMKTNSTKVLAKMIADNFGNYNQGTIEGEIDLPQLMPKMYAGHKLVFDIGEFPQLQGLSAGVFGHIGTYDAVTYKARVAEANLIKMTIDRKKQTLAFKLFYFGG